MFSIDCTETSTDITLLFRNLCQYAYASILGIRKGALYEKGILAELKLLTSATSGSRDQRGLLPLDDIFGDNKESVSTSCSAVLLRWSEP